MNCPPSHAILKYREADRPIDDLSGEMQTAYVDAVRLRCGHDKVSRYARIQEKTQEEIE